MKIQADITTCLLDRLPPFYLNEKEVCLADILNVASIDTLRLSIFSQNSSLLSFEKSLEMLDLSTRVRLLSPQITQINAETRSHIANYQKNSLCKSAKICGQSTCETAPVENTIKQGLYLCIHCSDTWADPSHQDIPAAWNFSDMKGLKFCFVDYLTFIFETVKAKNINVRYIQVGNEISNGLLWPFLRSPYEYVDFVKTAHYLCRQYFPTAAIVLHTDLSYSSEKANQWYEVMEKTKVDYDLVGLSYYPVWHGPLKELEKTVSDVSQLTGKKVILNEIGYMNTEQKTSAWFGHWKCDDIPYSPEGQRLYLEYFKEFLQQKLTSYLHPEMFYWGMFSYHNDEHFPVALFDRRGNALPTFYELNR